MSSTWRKMVTVNKSNNSSCSALFSFFQAARLQTLATCTPVLANSNRHGTIMVSADCFAANKWMFVENRLLFKFGARRKWQKLAGEVESGANVYSHWVQRRQWIFCAHPDRILSDVILLWFVRRSFPETSFCHETCGQEADAVLCVGEGRLNGNTMYGM